MDKNIKLGTAIAKSQKNYTNTQKEEPEFHNNCSIKPEAKKNPIKDFTAKAKMTITKFASNERVKKMKTSFLEWIDMLPNRLATGILRGIVIGILLNVIASYFWPELPETIPTIYEFFNGFVIVGEFIYKTALGGLAAIFNGTIIEFGNTMMAEIGELWNTFVTWISAISF